MRLSFVGALSILVLLGLSVIAQSPLNMEFVNVRAGEFMMGCSSGDTVCNPDESPRHRVEITKSFDIGKYEVTQAQWAAVMQTNPSSNKGDKLPVETVSKLEIQDFISKLNDRHDGYRYRLPTEAEWEYAARAGTDSPSAGVLKEIAWFEDNSEDSTHPVGQKKPNAWGIYDMLGNVREFVSDFYSGDYYRLSPAIDPKGPQLPTDGRGFGGRGFRGGPPPPFAPPQPPPPPPAPKRDLRGASQQEQIDALRDQVEELQRQLQQLRNAFDAGPFRGGPPPGFGPQQGPVVVGPDGQFIDPLDGLPTGLPVIRGGGWDQPAAFVRVSARYSYYGPTLRLSDIGFRLVRERAVN